jgi:hypothetical protein
MLSVKEILKSMYDAVEGIADKTYLQDRPKATDDRINSYIVVELPSNLSSGVIDAGVSDYDDYTSTCRFTLFVRNRTRAGNINEIDINKVDALMTSLLNIFPVADGHVQITSPSVVLSGDDESGFHYIFIQARLRTI